MKKILLLSAVVIFLFSCSSSKNTQPTAERDGSSFEKAIIIKSKTDAAGTAEEYNWLKKNYPGYRMKNQSLLQHNKRPYDLLKFVTSTGDQKEIYFDITNSFGKF